MLRARVITFPIPLAEISPGMRRTMTVLTDEAFVVERLVFKPGGDFDVGLVSILVGDDLVFEAADPQNPMPCFVVSELCLPKAPAATPHRPIEICLHNMSDHTVQLQGSIIGYTPNYHLCAHSPHPPACFERVEPRWQKTALPGYKYSASGSHPRVQPPRGPSAFEKAWLSEQAHAYFGVPREYDLLADIEKLTPEDWERIADSVQMANTSADGSSPAIPRASSNLDFSEFMRRHGLGPEYDADSPEGQKPDTPKPGDLEESA